LKALILKGAEGMPVSIISQLKQIYIKYEFDDSKHPLRGCSEAQVQAVMFAQMVTYLPEIYLEFLRKLGQEAGLVWCDVDYRRTSLVTLKQEIIEYLAYYQERLQVGQVFELPTDAFVFSRHEDHFHFFHTQDQSPDPAVFMGNYSGHIQKICDHLSEYFEGEIQTAIELGEEKKRRREERQKLDEATNRLQGN
jgi:hypothetical protein